MQAVIVIALTILGILVLSGFFSGTESALTSLQTAEVETLLQQNKMGAKTLEKVNKQLDRSVMTVLVFNNIVNIAGSIVVGNMVIKLYGDAVLAVITTGLTFGIIIFSEIIPKSLAIHYAVPVSLAVAPIIYTLNWLLYPFIVVLEAIVTLFKRGERKEGTEDQIRSLVSIGRREGHIETDEGQLIHRAFILNDKTAGDIMTPLKDMVSLQDETTIADAAKKVVEAPYTRYPVFGTSIHEVVGTVISHDLLDAFYQKKEGETLSTITRKPMVVESAQPADELLFLFRDTHRHLAVVQEDGKTVGIVTLEDVLEELVGEIEDEVDTDADAPS